MSQTTFVRYEVLRTFRNGRFFLFSMAFPLLLFYLVAGPLRHSRVQGVPSPLYFMCGMATWGTMISVISTGARIAGERQAQWIRQLRITPLPSRVYLQAKLVCGHLMALASLAVFYLAGMSLGVRLPVLDWLKLTGLLLVGLVPLAALGVLLGHLLKVETIGPVMGGLTGLLSLLAGSYGPLFSGGVLLALARCIPSYWLVQVSRTTLGTGSWLPAQAWVVFAAWTAVLAFAAARAYRRDTARA